MIVNYHENENNEAKKSAFKLIIEITKIIYDERDSWKISVSKLKIRWKRRAKLVVLINHSFRLMRTKLLEGLNYE